MAGHHRYGKKSVAHLDDDVHYDLVRLCYLALKYSPYDIGITSSKRTIEEQEVLFKNGDTWTMDSKHLIQPDGTVHAIDFIVYTKDGVSWKKGHYRKVIQAFVRAAIELGIQVEFGGLWESVFDGPHVELSFPNK